MSTKATCAVCGMGGYWVAYDPTTKEQRCVNHIGSTPESLRYAAKLAHGSDDLSSGGVSS